MDDYEEINIESTPIFDEVQTAKDDGYMTVSAQGSARSGKTYNIMIWLVVYCLEHDGTAAAVVRGTMPALRGSVYRDFVEIADKLGVYNRKRLNKSEMIYSFENGSFIEFFSVDNEQKLRGRKRAILYINEANEITQLEFQQLQMRTTEFTIIDYNPSFSEEHWICADVNKDQRTKHFITTYRDNPFLEKRVIDEIESLQTKNQSLWRVYGLGLQAIIEGLVYRDVEYIDEFPKTLRQQWLGIDFGYTNDPTAIVRVGYNGKDTLYIEELRYQTEMLTKDIINTIKQVNAGLKRHFKVISESADPRLVQEIYNAGIDVHPVKKYAGSVLAGIQFMQGLKLVVCKNSFNVKKEVNNYTYRQDKDGHWLNEPIDAYNHALDAVRYVCMNELMGKNKHALNAQQISEIIN